jgi:hypothetical protein
MATYTATTTDAELEYEAVQDIRLILFYFSVVLEEE